MSITNNLPHVTSLIFDFDGTLAPNLDLPDMRRQLIAHTVACALGAERSVEVTLAGEGRFFDGEQGLAPEWADESTVCGEQCQASLAACLYARRAGGS